MWEAFRNYNRRESNLNKGWYRLTVYSFLTSSKKDSSGNLLPKIVEFKIVSIIDAARMFNIGVEFLAGKDFGCIYNQPSSDNDDIWMRLSKYPEYLKVV